VKVIFLEDVANVGRVGQVRTVADGYARNYLFPRKLAILANSQAAAAIEAQIKKKVNQRELEEAEMAELAKQIEGIEITLKAKVGENEKLYGSITSADIAEALSQAAGREIDKKKIELHEPIKQAGSTEVTVRLAHEITAAIQVNVISEEAVEAPTAEAEKPEAKKEKAAKKGKKEKAVKEKKEAVLAKAVKEEAEAKPTKEKKAKKAKAEKEETAVAEAPAAEKPAEEKKERKPRAKAKKTEEATGDKKES
jgi:large subunit ribosomal protein L9